MWYREASVEVSSQVTTAQSASTPSASRRVTRFLRVFIGLAVGGLALLLIDWRSLLPTLHLAMAKAFSRQALALAVCGQLVALTLCAAGLRVLDARLTWRSAFLSRWVRDGVGSLPAGLPGLGEVASVRILGLFGLSAAAGVTLTAADVLAETISQGIYAATAAVLAPSSLRIPVPKFDFPVGPAILMGGLGVLVLGLALRLVPKRWLAGVLTALSEARRGLSPKRLAASFVLHLAAWLVGGVQIFVLAKVLDAPLTLPQAMSLEGLVFALRAAFFFVPAGAGVQEIGVAAVGAGYGLSPVDTAAIALLLRLRDVVVLTPGLVLWGVIELRRALAPVQAPPAPLANGNLPCR